MFHGRHGYIEMFHVSMDILSCFTVSMGILSCFTVSMVYEIRLVVLPNFIFSKKSCQYDYIIFFIKLLVSNNNVL